MQLDCIEHNDKKYTGNLLLKNSLGQDFGNHITKMKEGLKATFSGGKRAAEFVLCKTIQLYVQQSNSFHSVLRLVLTHR